MPGALGTSAHQPVLTTVVNTAPPGPAEAFAAYRTVDSWIRAWQMPDAPALDTLPAVGGAMVVLRYEDQIIGRGSSSLEGPGAIVEAAREALEEANRRMPVDNDALRDETIRQLAGDVTLSLELAGAMIPLDARSFDEAAARLSPGIDGVAARMGSRTAAVFPSAILAQSIAPRSALSSAASQAGNNAALGLSEMDVLLDQHGARFYRFRVAHIAQPSRGAAPVFLTRGQRLVPLSEIGRRQLGDMADRIAEHLLTRAWPGREAYGMLGVYDPGRDVYEPRLSSPIEQMTAGLALVRYSTTLDAGSPRRAELLASVDRLLADLVRVEPGEERAASDPALAAAWVVLTAERRRVIAVGEGAPARPDESAPFDEECRRTVLTCFSMDNGFAANLPTPAQALVALALVKMAGDEQGGQLRAEAIMLADAAGRAVFRNATPGDLVSRMPWLGWAEQELAALRGDERLGSATALREMRTLIWEHQVGPTNPAGDDARGGGPDMVGGIVFNAGAKPGEPTPLPTWQSARPAVFLASMLRDERLTPRPDRPLELARLVGLLRFLRQLQVDDATLWMCQNRRRAVGGIRSATWDQRLPADASSMTLLALVEALRSLDSMTAP